MRFAALALTLLFAQVAERVDVNLVNVDVTVLEHGKVVSGLTKNDFTVFDDGRKVAITHFAAVTPDDPLVHRAIVVLVDERLPGDKLQRNRVLAALGKMVADTADGSMWCIETLNDPSGIRTVVEPTTDRAVVQAGLESIRLGSKPPDQAQFAAVYDPNDNFQCETADCVERESGHKIVGDAAWFVAAAFQTTRRARLMNGSRDVLLVTDAAPSGIPNAVLEEAAGSNVRFFILAPAGPGSAGYWLAQKSGGLVLASNRLEESLRQFDEATKHFYELAFPPGPADNRYHKIIVRLDKRGRYNVLHREGYVSRAQR